MKAAKAISIDLNRRRVLSFGLGMATLAWRGVALEARATTLSETHSPPSAVVGGQLTFNYTLSNPGTTPGIFTNPLAPNVVFVSANITNGSYTVSNKVFYYTPDTGIAHPSIVFKVVVTPVTAPNVTNTAYWVPNQGPVLTSGEVVPVTSAQAGPKMVVGRVAHRTVLLRDGRVLVTGGSAVSGSYLAPTATAEVYLPSANSFSLVSNMNTPHRFHTLTLLPNGLVLVAGGENSTTSATTSIELFDPTNNVFIPAGNMAVARTLHTATLLPNGDVMLAGGVGPDTRIERFSFVAGQPTLSLAGNLAVPRSNHLATVLSTGEILFAGGAAAASAFAEKYDPVTGISVPVSEAGHVEPAVAIAGGKVLLYCWTVQPHYVAELYAISVQ